MTTDSIKDKLLAKRSEYTQRVEAIKKDFAKGRSADFSEQTTESENDEVLRSLRHDAEQEIRQINHALDRLNQGDYGICEKCGNDIAPARLQTIPEATLCTGCA